MTFRPLPGLTIATIIALLILLALGTWQLERRTEKHALLDQIRARETLPAAPIEVLLPVGAYGAFRQATAQGSFANDQEIFVVHARVEDGPTRPGVRVLTPFTLASGGTILVDRGWVDDAHKDPSTRRDGQVEGVTEVTGTLQQGGRAAYFTPPPDIAKRVFYVRDVAQMTKSFGLSLRSPLIFEVAQGPAGGPQAIPSRVAISDNHLSYAITWYSLAIVLIVVYLRYHQTLGRLTFRT
jgi:surfeit locus 1 family protein